MQIILTREDLLPQSREKAMKEITRNDFYRLDAAYVFADVVIFRDGNESHLLKYRDESSTTIIDEIHSLKTIIEDAIQALSEGDSTIAEWIETRLDEHDDVYE